MSRQHYPGSMSANATIARQRVCRRGVRNGAFRSSPIRQGSHPRGSWYLGKSKDRLAPSMLPAHPTLRIQSGANKGALYDFALMAPILAPASERGAILAVMDRAFAAVNSKVPDDWHALQLAEGTTLSFRPHHNG